MEKRLILTQFVKVKLLVNMR